MVIRAANHDLTARESQSLKIYRLADACVLLVYHECLHSAFRGEFNKHVDMVFVQMGYRYLD